MTVKFHFMNPDEVPVGVLAPKRCSVCRGELKPPTIVALIRLDDDDQGLCAALCRDCQGTPEEMTDRLLGETEEEGLS